MAREYWDSGVRHIVALRGDAPAGEDYVPHPQGYAYAADLVAGLKRVGDFEISVAAYPEMHPTADSMEADIDNLRRKLDAGATRAITQYFFDGELFLRFLDRAMAAGISAPIVPGIMPVTNYAQAKKFSAMCGTSVPDWMGTLFAGTENDPETRRMVAAIVAAEQVRLLQANGVDEFHFYTLNRADLTYAIAHLLGVKPSVRYSGRSRNGLRNSGNWHKAKNRATRGSALTGRTARNSAMLRLPAIRPADAARDATHRP